MRSLRWHPDPRGFVSLEEEILESSPAPRTPIHRSRAQGGGGHLGVSTPEAGALVWDFWPPVRKRIPVVQATSSILLWQPELRHNPLQVTLNSFTFCPPKANNHCGVFYFICVVSI